MIFHPHSSFIHRIVRFLDGTLQIEFNNKSIYTYYQVPQHIQDNLMKAESVGKYFHLEQRHFKNFYRHR